MSDLLAKLFDIGKLPSRVVLLFGVVSGIFLFAPSTLTRSLGTQPVVETHRFVFGLVFVASSSLLMINVCIWFLAKFRDWHAAIAFRSGLPCLISNLDFAEISVLREYWLQGKSTITLPLDDPTVAGLVEKRFLRLVGEYRMPTIAGVLTPMQMNPILSIELKREQLESYSVTSTRRARMFHVAMGSPW